MTARSSADRSGLPEDGTVAVSDSSSVSDSDDGIDDEKRRLEEIHSELVEQGWDGAEIDEERQAVVVEKFGKYLIRPDGEVEGEGTLREKLELAVEGVVS